MFLSDSELAEKLRGSDPIIAGLDERDCDDPYAGDSSIQPCSVDLRIGEIFDPAAAPGGFGSEAMPRHELVLEPGQTAVVTTLERCQLPNNIAAVGFPPNNVSSKGILMTNPGHVDPGYDKAMTFTVINMSKDKYVLSRGNKIVTLLFTTLGKSVQRDFKERREGSSTRRVDEVRAALSPDFLDISGRVKRAADAEEVKTRRVALAAPIVAAIFASLAAGLFLRGEISDLKAETSAYGDTRKLEKEVGELKQELALIDPSTLLKADKE